MKAQRGHRWTTEETKMLMQMWADEHPLEDIAEKLGVSAKGVSKMITRLRANGVPLKRRTVGHVQGRRNAPWTQSEVEYLFRRRNEKATAEDIARELSRTMYGVQGMILKLRQEGANVGMLGHGVRRLWDVDALRAVEIVQDANVAQINRFRRVVGE